MVYRKTPPEFADSYNERLFEKRGIRSYFHLARFDWFNQRISHYSPHTQVLFELGCFDGRLLDHIPWRVEKYIGFDANWEGGLSAALEKFANSRQYEFRNSEDPRDLHSIAAKSVNVSVAMETLEHLPPDKVEDYLKAIARVTNGYFFVTVPNEKGLVFLLKYFAKILFYGGAQPYTLRELLCASLGRIEGVHRDDHKGFDYDQLLQQLSAYFEIVEVSAIPFPKLPVWMGFTIGIVGRSYSDASRGL